MHISESAIERTVDTMWCRYADPLTLNDLADEAILSKFYYSRVFRAVTGTTPGRFLTAIRVFMAKRLLLETMGSVTDIAYGVGYNSVGTFTSRFTRSVGLSPGRYRSLPRDGMSHLTSFDLTEPGQPGSQVTGQVRMPAAPGEAAPRVYVAAFPGPVVEGVPQACDVLETPGPYRLNLPAGLWFLRAAAVESETTGEPRSVRFPMLVGQANPIRVTSGPGVRIDLSMRSYRRLDLPILLALPELDAPQPYRSDEMASTG